MVAATLAIVLVATATTTDEHVTLVSGDHVSSRALRLLPNTLGLSTMFEQVIGPVVVLVEESGGFADVDPEKIAIYGDSWTWTKWYVDGFDVSDPLFDGAAGFHVPFAAIGSLALRFDENPANPRRQGVSLLTEDVTTAGAAARVGEVGGRFFWALPLMAAFSGKHATERTPPPTAERRQFGPSFDLFIAEGVDIGGGRLSIASQAKQSERRYLEFAYDGTFEGVVPENVTMASLLARYQPSHGRYDGLFLAEVLSRDQLGAEVGRAPSESARMSKVALFAGVGFESGQASLSVAHYDIAARDRLFERDVIDPDGEALFPFDPDGRTLAIGTDVRLEHGPFYAWAANRALVWTPARNTWTQNLTFADQPYGSWTFSTRDTVTFIGDERVGVRGQTKGPVGFGYDLFASGQYTANRTDGGALGFIDFGLRARATLPVIGAFTPFIAIAKTPMPLSTAVARQIDPAYLGGALTLSDGRTIDNVGGDLIRIDDRLTGPNVYRAAIGLEIDVSEHFRMGAQGMFKLYRGLFQVAYDGDSRSFGTFVDGVFYTNERTKRYVLTNNEDLPVYFAFDIDATTRGLDDFFFSASFSAYNAVGETAFGNGPTANDLGVVDYAFANPNARRMAQAALDLDRAFVLKIAVAYQPIEDLWLSATLRHRDGQPFSFLDIHENDGQVASTYHSNRGSPFQYQRPLAGPREDFQLGADVQIAYAYEGLEFWVLAANIFDMENEIHEVNGPPGIDGRAALESQLPRSLLFGIRTR